jgi:hypothetical protein
LGILLLLFAVGLGYKTYSVWQQGPWDLPQPAKPKPAPVPAPLQVPTPVAKPPVGTEVIVSKNLFDPERGAVKTQESEAEVRAVQKVRSMILLGTAIIGPNRYAIVQEPDNVPGVPVPPNQPRTQTTRRLKLGDNVEGFSVAEIADRKVVLTKGPTRVEVAVDYFRKVTPGPTGPQPPQFAPPQQGPVAVPQPGPAVVPQQPIPAPGGPTTPPVIPNLPRRPRLPTPPSP